MPSDRAPSRAAWLRSRTRNAARRGLLVAAVSSLVTVATLLLFILIPRQVDQQLTRALRGVPPNGDTLVWLRTLGNAKAAEARAVSALDSLVRDAAAHDSLGQLIARARSAPLLESYQALAAAPALQRDVTAQALLRDIARVHTAREASAALSGPDARYAMLTRELTTLGHALVAHADSIAIDVATQIAVPTDSLWQDSLHRASRALAEAESTLGTVRVRNDSLGQVREGLRRDYVLVLPTWAMLGAALVLGFALGFAVALWREIRNPTVADAAELTAITGVRVFEADASRDDIWPLLHLTLSSIGDVVGQVQVLSVETGLSARIGLALASVAARESRATVLVDGTRRGRTIDTMLTRDHLRPAEPPAGVEPVHDHHWQGDWALPVGRDQAVDLLWPDRGVRLSSVADPLKRRLGGYDLVVAITDQVEPRTVPLLPDVVLGVRMSTTTLAWLRAAMATLRANDRRVRAVIVWNGELPLVG